MDGRKFYAMDFLNGYFASLPIDSTDISDVKVMQASCYGMNDPSRMVTYNYHFDTLDSPITRSVHQAMSILFYGALDPNTSNISLIEQLRGWYYSQT